MNKFVKYFLRGILTLIGVGVIALAILFPILFIPIGLGMILGIVWIVTKKLRARKLIGTNIPQEVLNDFDYAEKRYLASDGKESPSAILWDIAKHRRQGIELIKMKGGEIINGEQSRTKRDRSFEAQSSGTRIRALPRTDYGRQELQASVNSEIRLDAPEVGPTHRKSGGGLFRKRRR